MTDARPVMRAADIRRLAMELAERGCTVRVEPDGAIVATPPAAKGGDDFDLVDMRR
ncbi:hypothetical protein [Cereibacter sphaeroides]|uniref:hypothetical protein n=1 Tax=Cereibacter sphaeroides TaxID=1063 RepID=UPI0015F914BE|nr:hypothetical protein [Cereibacter sphaeroides]